MKRVLTQKIWMLIGLLTLAAMLFFISVLLARMRPDSGRPIHWQGYETSYTNLTTGGGVR